LIPNKQTTLFEVLPQDDGNIECVVEEKIVNANYCLGKAGIVGMLNFYSNPLG
jgi:hypothetical protein